ncbi:hypothetical protein Sango_2877900 [Sesamum angolense]|uniref:SWIM-type domain-containing protein n=1 Tax=Sesamum angolense TaxID=2727404 RepID=A0AAE1VZ80_9LAMI|nr:hypothetical protein Sango_2877900 [Sesamum angolense]
MPIKKDRDLQYFFNPMTGYVLIDIFVQAEKIREMVVPDDPAVNEWGTYMSMLTQELSSVPVVTQSMGRFGINDDYPDPLHMQVHQIMQVHLHLQVSICILFTGPSDYAEPDEVEVEGLTTNNPENNDEAMHPEVPADSIDILLVLWGNFYDSNTGELAIGMVFKSKDHLKASVQDFSVRFARREYRVVESKPKLWKVACKYDQQTGSSWMLRGIFHPNMGLFKITKYAGPHTCLMNEISVEHAREQVYGTWESSVKKLPRFMAFLQKLNPGIVVEWLNLEMERPDVQMLHYVFWAFRPCIEGFRSCRNVINRHSGLISAINYVPTLKFPRGVHRFCLCHVCSNFNKKFNNIRLKDLCWRAGQTQWTLSHDSGWRTGILTTNMSECVNGVLKGAKRLPIVAIVQITFHRSVRYFLERTTRCHRLLNANQEWADFAFRIFEAQQAEAVHHIVQKFDYNQQSASVLTLSLTGQVSHTYVVKLKHKTCSCGKWGTHGIPCSHAIQVSRHFGVNASNFITQYYSIRAYRKTYQGRFELLYGEEYWDPVDFELVHNPAVRVRRGPDRYVSTRIPNEMDRPQALARQQYQSRQV